MTYDDELRARLAELDPARRSGALAESPTAHQIRERIMQTIDDTTVTPLAPKRRSRSLLVASGVAASVAAVALGVTVLGGGDAAPRPAPRTPTTVALKAPANGAMSSCMIFSADVLRDMPVALAGTVVAVTPSTVTLDVDRWYKGGSADQVTISTQGTATSVALDGVEFSQGGRYLVTATNGTVNTCGYSGPASAELEKTFAEAFPG